MACLLPLLVSPFFFEGTSGVGYIGMKVFEERGEGCRWFFTCTLPLERIKTIVNFPGGRFTINSTAVIVFFISKFGLHRCCCPVLVNAPEPGYVV